MCGCAQGGAAGCLVCLGFVAPTCTSAHPLVCLPRECRLAAACRQCSHFACCGCKRFYIILHPSFVLCHHHRAPRDTRARADQRVELMRTLLAAGAHPNDADELGNRSLHMVCCTRGVGLDVTPGRDKYGAMATSVCPSLSSQGIFNPLSIIKICPCHPWTHQLDCGVCRAPMQAKRHP